MSEIRINPFTTQGMIRDPRLFFGRKTELDTIWGYLRKDANVSIVAERRMGKSSLLWFVKEMAKDHLEAQARVHYLDMELVPDSEDFFSRLAEVLNAGGETVRDLERALANQRLILCMDEFDRTANHFDAFPRDFFAVLRGLSQGPALTLAIATKTPLIDFSASGGMTSPFYNIFPPAPLTLGMFAEAEARDLLVKTAARAEVKFDETILAAAIRLAEGHPWRLQLLGHYLVESGLKWDEAQKRFESAMAEEEDRAALSLNDEALDLKETAFRREGEAVKGEEIKPPDVWRDRLAASAGLLTFIASAFAFYSVTAREPLSMFIAIALVLGVVAGYVGWRFKERRG